MNSRKKILMLVYMLLLITTCPYAQQINKPYRFPIKPGMTEWNELNTHDEMLAVLQIPEDILQNMSTEALVETCLNYPLFPDIWAFNSYQEGIDKAISSFNGFQKLLQHKNAGVELLKRYQKINLEDLEQEKTNTDKWKFKIKVCEIEALLSQFKILQYLQKSEVEILLRHTLDKSKVIRTSGKYSFFSYETNTYLALKILSTSNYEILNQKLKDDKNLEKFYRIGTGLNEKTLLDIVEMAHSFLLNTQ